MFYAHIVYDGSEYSHVELSIILSLCLVHHLLYNLQIKRHVSCLYCVSLGGYSRVVFPSESVIGYVSLAETTVKQWQTLCFSLIAVSMQIRQIVSADGWGFPSNDIINGENLNLYVSTYRF